MRHHFSFFFHSKQNFKLFFAVPLWNKHSKMRKLWLCIPVCECMKNPEGKMKYGADVFFHHHKAPSPLSLSPFPHTFHLFSSIQVEFHPWFMMDSSESEHSNPRWAFCVKKKVAQRSQVESAWFYMTLITWALTVVTSPFLCASH